jgi:hypothetical protein
VRVGACLADGILGDELLDGADTDGDHLGVVGVARQQQRLQHLVGFGHG